MSPGNPAREVIIEGLYQEGFFKGGRTPMIADAILTALSSAGIDCEGWRTIESAPKDGTRIILFGTMQGSSVPGEEFGHWFASSNRENGGWWVVFAMPFKPTHWRPRPLPPLASGGG